MPPLAEKVRQAVIRFSVKPGDVAIVAVSGGPDSVCLLHLLKNLPYPYQLFLHVAHLNHQFRTEAADEARFVEDLAQEWGIPVTIGTRPVAEICKEKGLSKQAGARMVRYQFLQGVAKKIGAKWIVFGHTADDQAETVLMRILRGAGPTGLRGIPEQRDTVMIRPLLLCTRAEIIQELSEKKIPYIEDPSNQDTRYLRNKIRHTLIPILEQYNPKIKEALCRETIVLQDENDFMHQAMLQQCASSGIKKEDHSITYDLPAFKQLHVALQRRLLHWGVHALLNDSNDIGFQQIEILRTQILAGKTGGFHLLPHCLVVKKHYSTFILERVTRDNENKVSPIKIPRNVRRILPNVKRVVKNEYFLPEITIIPSSTTFDLPAWDLRLNISLSSQSQDPFSACIASFDFDKIPQPLSIRAWRSGDRFAPLGMGGHHKKLQDFFVDIKIIKEERHHIPLLSCSKGILWVLGYRIDERFRRTERTTHTLTIRFEKGNHDHSNLPPATKQRMIY